MWYVAALYLLYTKSPFQRNSIQTLQSNLWVHEDIQMLKNVGIQRCCEPFTKYFLSAFSLLVTVTDMPCVFFAKVLISVIDICVIDCINFHDLSISTFFFTNALPGSLTILLVLSVYSVKIKLTFFWHLAQLHDFLNHVVFQY